MSKVAPLAPDVKLTEVAPDSLSELDPEVEFSELEEDLVAEGADLAVELEDDGFSDCSPLSAFSSSFEVSKEGVGVG